MESSSWQAMLCHRKELCSLLQKKEKKKIRGLRVRVGIQQPREPGQITGDICSRLRDVPGSQGNGAGEPSRTLLPWHGTHKQSNIRLNELSVSDFMKWLWVFLCGLNKTSAMFCFAKICLGLGTDPAALPLDHWLLGAYIASFFFFKFELQFCLCYCMLSTTILILLSRPDIPWGKKKKNS